MAAELHGEALIKCIVASLMKGYERKRETFESIQAFQARMEKEVRYDYANIPHEDFAKKYENHGAKIVKPNVLPKKSSFKRT